MMIWRGLPPAALATLLVAASECRRDGVSPSPQGGEGLAATSIPGSATAGASLGGASSGGKERPSGPSSRR